MLTLTPELKAAFQFHLRTIASNRQGKKAEHWLKLQRDLDAREGGPARRALNAARRDVESGTCRYPSGYRSGNVVTYQPGQPGIAYVDKPESVGLRYVGQVSPEFRRGPFGGRDSEGWLTDPYGDTFKDGTGLCYGEVYQLPGKDGESRFVAGYRFGGWQIVPMKHKKKSLR